MLEFTGCGTFSATGSSAAGHSTCPPTSVDGISGPLQPMSGFAMCAARGRGDLILSQAPLFASVLCISGLVVEYVVAIDVTRVPFPADANTTSGGGDPGMRFSTSVYKCGSPLPYTNVFFFF